MRSIVRSFQALIRNKRLSLAIFALVSIAVVFWSLSRVPALSEKAQMGVRTNITSIAFDVIAPVTANDGLVVRIAKTTANWLFTNWKGMTFGLLFSAAALTLLGTVRRRSFERAWLNTLSRMFFGAPLGVCVNCATPIAQGLYSAGARLETALATLISSPTLNVIVLSMSFTLLPWEIAFASVAGVFAILISLPWIIRIFAKDAAIANSNRPNNMLPPAPTPIMELETWGDAAAAGAKDFLKNLFFVVRVALPLMLLAGALGAAVIEVTPLKGLTELSASITTILMVSLVAVFLPVPMAFNVIVVMVLLNAGMNPGLAAVLLFGLSVFSIYPAAVLARQISARLSLALTTCMVIVAAVLGIATDTYFQHSEHQKRENLRAANQEISTNIVGQVVQICSSLPQHLVARCYSQQMPAMMDVVEGVDLCSDLPLAIDESGCRQALRLTRIRIAALERGSTEPCMRLGSQQSRRSCLRVVAPEVAMKDRDMEVCNQLSQPSDIQSCRNAYLNASLLFNPDDSACMHLEGDAKTLCGLNAQIYRIADAENLALCDDLGGDAGVVQQCRWVTATSLVGKRNDTSGCEMLSDEPRSRCLEHAFAWKAQRTQDFQPCQMIESKDLRDTCQVRAASAKVKFILATQTRAASIPKEPEQAKSEQHTNDSIDVKVMDVVDVYKDDSINIKGFPYNSSEEEKTFRKKISMNWVSAQVGILRRRICLSPLSWEKVCHLETSTMMNGQIFCWRPSRVFDSTKTWAVFFVSSTSSKVISMKKMSSW
ncbi:MAG: permease [Pseudomonadota bacterium]